MATTSYAASSAAVLVAAASTSPFFAITGSSTKTVRVRRIVLGGFTLTSVAYLNIFATKTSTSISGGTPTAFTAVPINSGYSAATAALVQGYTAAPTAGTAVGVVASKRVLGQATTAAAGGYPEVTVELDFSKFNGIVLQGTAQGLELAFSGAPATAVSMTIYVEWDEE